MMRHGGSLHVFLSDFAPSKGAPVESEEFRVERNTSNPDDDA
jgi:hypothetical protein